ncbi:hypothetical protein EJB05_50023, partial [Eragrostis curvula]
MRIAVAAAFLALVMAPATQAQAPNVTAVLEKSGQHTKFLNLLHSQRVNVILDDDGSTVFAPTDNAFESLEPGTLNSLTQQQMALLAQGHILPQFHTLVSFETANNPVHTQASGRDGSYTLNITVGTNNLLNVSTGIVDPLAVYSIDKVLWPHELVNGTVP